jgi:Na+/proline symporter
MGSIAISAMIFVVVFGGLLVSGYWRNKHISRREIVFCAMIAFFFAWLLMPMVNPKPKPNNPVWRRLKTHP